MKSSVTDITSSRNEQKVSVYPNPMIPGKETLIQYQYPIDKIEIFSLNGRLIYSKQNNNSENTVILNHNLPAGIYMIKVYSNTIYTVKLIVNNDNQ
ncbi:MAG: hypothetical protein BGN96_08950 [Bacteroidales bacterium 45-6]|nr:MAG: hypothetical protein BGN96_08950 [Bacteroidales bacterium 45-6]